MNRLDSESDRTGLATARDPFSAGMAKRSSLDEADEVAIGAFDGVTVLVVEDDPVAREALEVIFAYYGARVSSAESMREALALFERDVPSLVVSDIGLRQGDGYMLLRAIRAREQGRRRHIPAIAVSGFPSHATADRARQAGFDAFVRKPVEIKALLKLAHQLAVPH
jgi:CheY-like chemotaxis protein